jgi:hypothetical protein
LSTGEANPVLQSPGKNSDVGQSVEIMKRFFSADKVAARLGLVLTAAVCAGLLSSCATAPESSGSAGVFKFSVLQYKEPVEVKGWVIDPAQSANPEGAALNITTMMQKGDVDSWLASWDNAERPTLTKEDRDALLEKWRPLKDGQVSVLGRVVAGADLVIELSVANPEQKSTKLQLPLKHSNDQWWLTAMDPTSEFLNWQNSTNTIVAQMEAINLKTYLKKVQGGH